MAYPFAARAAVIVGALGLVSAGACSSSSSLPSQAVVAATLGAGPGAGGTCSGFQSPSSVLTLGVPGQPAIDGSGSAAGKVHVSCSVKGSGSYAIQLSAALDAPTASQTGSITITGSGISPQGGSADVNLTAQGGSYSQTGCAVTYTYMGQQLTTDGVATGRFWGHVSCLAATDPNITVGSGMSSTCDIEADVRFENCST